MTVFTSRPRWESEDGVSVHTAFFQEPNKRLRCKETLRPKSFGNRFEMLAGVDRPKSNNFESPYDDNIRTDELPNHGADEASPQFCIVHSRPTQPSPAAALSAPSHPLP